MSIIYFHTTKLTRAATRLATSDIVIIFKKKFSNPKKREKTRSP